MRNLKDVGTAIKDIRIEKGLSQSDIRMISGMTQQQISKLENGNDVKLSSLLRVLEGYGLEIAFVSPSKASDKNNNQINEPIDAWSHIIDELGD